MNAAIKFVLENEGGYNVDNGGPTNYGVTAKYLISENLMQFDKNQDGIIDSKDMKAFTLDDAIFVYDRWFNLMRYNEINNMEIAKRIFDMSVNSGDYRGVRIAQSASNRFLISEGENYGDSLFLRRDGILGDKTIGFLNSIKKPYLYLNFFKIERISFYKSLAEKSPEIYQKYLKGWIKRASI
jgi:lysozyme family protein